MPEPAAQPIHLPFYFCELGGAEIIVVRPAWYLTQVTSMLLGQFAGQLFISKTNQLNCHFSFLLFILWVCLGLVGSIELRINLPGHLDFTKLISKRFKIKPNLS